MKDDVYFLLGSLTQTEDITKLQGWLEGTGLEAKIVEKRNGKEIISFLQITCDYEVHRTKRTRNAGRPFIGHNGKYTCGEIRGMQMAMSNREIAEMLGLSERSFYRRLKENAESLDDELFI